MKKQQNKIASPDPLQFLTTEEVMDTFKKITGDDAEMQKRLESELSLLRLKRMNGNILWT